MRVSEIRVKRIRVNQGLGVYEFELQKIRDLVIMRPVVRAKVV